MKNKIITCIFSYGLMPILTVLKEQEKKENYELCSLIIEAIKDVHNDDKDIPTYLPDDPSEWIKTQLGEYFQWLGVTGDTMIANQNEYVNRVYKMLDIKRTYPIEI